MADQMLSGKVALITGAAGGQGAAESRLFVEQGCCVVMTDISESGFDIATDLGDQAVFIKHDVSNQSDWNKAVQLAVDQFGGLDILVNNAAIFQPKALQDTDPDLFTRHFKINQLGPYLGMAAVLEPMKMRGSGSIVNIASVGGLRGYPGEFAYCTTKWALRGMTRCAAADFAPFGIRVNGVYPGPIDTSMLNLSAEEDALLMKLVPLGRRGKASEVAEIVAFLASDKASYLTAAEVSVDGGMGL